MPTDPVIEASERIVATASGGPRAHVDVSARTPIGSSDLGVHRSIVSPDVQAGLREFVGELPGEGNVWAGQLAGNGGRDVLIYIPPGADDDAAFRLVFHFHGTNSQHIERRAPGAAKEAWVGWDRLTQTLDGAQALQLAVADNVALVYPFSAGKRMEPEWQGWSNKVYDRMWMHPAPPTFTDDFAVLHSEVVQILTERLGVHPTKLPARVLAEGHSAGGIALRNIARSGTELVSDYLFLDAGFYAWADGCHAEIRAHGVDARVILVIRDGGIADPMRGPDPWCVEMPVLAVTWPEVQAKCAADPKLRPRGDGITCARWRALAEDWPRVATWCEAMKEDMRGVADVIVHRTKVSHGKQPRAFFGGLQIPALIGTSAASASLGRRGTRRAGP
ncbi:hypothetical protein [Nannocystis pusilla]|uniref:Alpha/beta hydrolase n=1 Tax=Nannocystis pusilla TaxID=889268 RepID=A0ABS7U145_9BACT|nr:hypothetical protein [Nannocystis pusilla]MBZ5714248.1 hypothetical protein [Nannocystis pusilla]